MALVETLERVAGQRLEQIPSLNDAAFQLLQATTAHEKAAADALAAEDAYGEAVAFGNEKKLETTLKARDDANAKLQRRVDLLDAAKVKHAAAVRLQSDKAEADRLGKMAAAQALMQKAIEEAEPAIAALAAIVQRVADAQQESRKLAKPEEQAPLRWAFEHINNRLPSVIVERLKFLGSFNEIKFGLDWKDKQAGRIKWADALTKR